MGPWELHRITGKRAKSCKWEVNTGHWGKQQTNGQQEVGRQLPEIFKKFYTSRFPWLGLFDLGKQPVQHWLLGHSFLKVPLRTGQPFFCKLMPHHHPSSSSSYQQFLFQDADQVLIYQISWEPNSQDNLIMFFPPKSLLRWFSGVDTFTDFLQLFYITAKAYGLSKFMQNVLHPTSIRTEWKEFIIFTYQNPLFALMEGHKSKDLEDRKRKKCSFCNIKPFSEGGKNCLWWAFFSRSQYK